MTMPLPSLHDAERSALMQAVREAVQANEAAFAALARLLALGTDGQCSGLFLLGGRGRGHSKKRTVVVAIAMPSL